MTTTASESVRAGSFIDAGGISTHHHDAGSGTPVLLLHGSGPGVSAWTNWERTLPVLAEVSHVLAPDLVGFGATERPADIRYGLRSWADHVWSYLDALHLEKVSVVGNSLGGRIALAMAEDHPERLDRVVLMGTPAVGMVPTEGLKALRAYQPSEENMRELLTTYFAVDTSIITDELVRARYEASVAPGAHESYTAMFADPVHAGNDLAMSEAQARSVDLPVLLLHGALDRIVPAEVAWTMLGLLPNADLYVFARSGHWPQIERTDDFNDAVIRFLGLQGAGG